MTSQLWRKEDGRQEADAYGRDHPFYQGFLGCQVKLVLETLQKQWTAQFTFRIVFFDDIAHATGCSSEPLVGVIMVGVMMMPIEAPIMLRTALLPP